MRLGNGALSTAPIGSSLPRGQVSDCAATLCNAPKEGDVRMLRWRDRGSARGTPGFPCAVMWRVGAKRNAVGVCLRDKAKIWLCQCFIETT